MEGKEKKSLFIVVTMAEIAAPVFISPEKAAEASWITQILRILLSGGFPTFSAEAKVKIKVEILLIPSTNT